MRREVLPPRASVLGLILGVMVPCMSAVIIAGAHAADQLDSFYRRRTALNAVNDLAHRPCTEHRWIDPWGMSYAVYCSDAGNIAQSFGPDRIPNTSDDIWSNQ